MVPDEIGQCMVLVKLVIEQGPVGSRLDTFSSSPEDYGSFLGGVASIGRSGPTGPLCPMLQS